MEWHVNIFVRQNEQLVIRRVSSLEAGLGVDLNLVSLEEQLEAVRKEKWVIGDIKNPSLEVQLAAVRKDGSAIKYIKSPYSEVQLEAVKQNRWNIENIKNPCPEVCCLVYPELEKIFSDPGLICLDSPFRVKCGERVKELKHKFFMVGQIFIGD